MNDDDEPSGPDYVPTVKIVGGAHGTIRINKKDYDPAVHTLYVPPTAPASPLPAGSTPPGGTVGQPAGLGVPAETGGAGAPAKVFVAQLEPGKFYIVDAAGTKLKAKGYPTEAEAWTATLTLGA